MQIQVQAYTHSKGLVQVLNQALQIECIWSMVAQGMNGSIGNLLKPYSISTMHCTWSDACYFCVTSLTCSGLAADRLVYKHAKAVQ